MTSFSFFERKFVTLRKKFNIMNDEKTDNQNILHQTESVQSTMPAPIETGATLLNLYQVKDMVSAGGMGDVITFTIWNGK